MEDGDTAQGPAHPLGIVFLKLRIHRLEEWANERRLKRRAHNGAFVVDVPCFSTVHSE